MKKIISFILVLAMALAVAGCNQPSESPSTDPAAKSEGTMTYEQYMAADIDDDVVIEAFVQAKQSWWDNKATIYLQDSEGAYFVYEMTCSEADYAKLTKGTKIKVTGVKATFEGEIEIGAGATFEILEGNWIAPITDVTDKLGTDDLINYQNQYVAINHVTVVSVVYKSGENNDDIYLTVSKDGAEYEFCVEYYLTGPDSELYQAVEALEVGDVIDIEGFLYWYQGVNTHVTAVKDCTDN